MVDMSIEDRRRALIEALRSGDFKQTDKRNGALMRQRIEWESHNPNDAQDGSSGSYVPDKNSRQFCCIGVGDMMIRPDFYEHFDEDDQYDGGLGYDNFREYYDVDENLTNRLTGMNDGDWVARSKHSTYKRVYPQRDFKFIARFLEVIWFHGA